MPAVVSVQSPDLTESVIVFGEVPPRWSAVANLIVPTASLQVTASFAALCFGQNGPGRRSERTNCDTAHERQ